MSVFKWLYVEFKNQNRENKINRKEVNKND